LAAAGWAENHRILCNRQQVSEHTITGSAMNIYDASGRHFPLGCYLVISTLEGGKPTPCVAGIVAMKT